MNVVVNCHLQSLKQNYSQNVFVLTFFMLQLFTVGEFPVWCDILTTTQSNNKYPGWIIEGAMKLSRLKHTDCSSSCLLD